MRKGGSSRVGDSTDSEESVEEGEEMGTRASATRFKEEVDEELGEDLDLAGDDDDDDDDDDSGEVGGGPGGVKKATTWVEREAKIKGLRGVLLAAKLKSMGYESAEDFSHFEEDEHILRYDLGMEKDEMRKFTRAVEAAKAAAEASFAPAAPARPATKKGRLKPVKPKSPSKGRVGLEEPFAFII